MPAERHAVYQVSVMSALLDGVYDGDHTIGDLLRHGDFGLGTFNALDITVEDATVEVCIGTDLHLALR